MAETTYQKLKQFYTENNMPFREIEHCLVPLRKSITMPWVVDTNSNSNAS